MTGSFHPSKLLSDFDGESANGTWTLEVNDAVTGDTGTLVNWSLIVTSGEKSTATRTDGAYTFAFMPIGTYTIRTIAPSGSSVVGSTSQTATLTTISSSIIDRNFSVNRNNRFYGQVFDDTNGNGAFETGESPLPDYVIYDDTNNNSAFDNGESSLTTGTLGTAAFDLASGTHRMRVVGKPGWSFTVPVDGLRTVNASGSPLTDQRFGLQQSQLGPSGTDKTVSLSEDGVYTFRTNDFGFIDLRTPASNLLAVKVTTLPLAGQLRLSGVPLSVGQFVSVAQLDANSFTYTPAADGFGAPYASWTFQVQDDGGTAGGRIDLDPTPNTIGINVDPVNDAPQVTTSAGSTNYVGVAAVVVDSAVAISDVDSTTLVGATIEISGGLVSTEDGLSFTPAMESLGHTVQAQAPCH